MYKKGVVLSSENGEIKVKIISETEGFCDKCSIRGICNQKEDERIITLKYKKSITAGSEVLIKLNEGASISLSFLIFILPLMIFISSFLALKNFFNDGISAAFSIAILVIYFLIFAVFQKSLLSNVKIMEIKDKKNLNSL